MDGSADGRTSQEHSPGDSGNSPEIFIVSAEVAEIVDASTERLSVHKNAGEMSGASFLESEIYKNALQCSKEEYSTHSYPIRILPDQNRTWLAINERNLGKSFFRSTSWDTADESWF